MQYWSATGWRRAALIDLSRGGVLLRTLHGTTVGTQVQLLLQRAGDGQRMAVHGTVRSMDLAGTHIAFSSDFVEVDAWVGKVIKLQVLPTLERRLGKNPAEPELLSELSAWHREIGEPASGLPPAAVEALAAMSAEDLGALRRQIEEHLERLFIEIDGLMLVQRQLVELQEKAKGPF